jgi:hypothetical protein
VHTGINASVRLIGILARGAGLPDFSRLNIPKRGKCMATDNKIYQRTTKDHKIFQMFKKYQIALKYTKSFLSKAFKNKS